MLYERITTRAQLEALRAVPEGPMLDYKEFVEADEWWELAKDVSAFSNYLGGDLLVGVAETIEKTAVPKGLPRQKILEIEQAYEHAARDRCRPSPLVSFDRIPWESEREVLAMHVEPHPAALVAAQFYELNKNGRPVAANAWQFSVRVGRHNRPLTPDEFPMLMNPQVRRVLVLLESIPTACRREVDLAYRARRVDDVVQMAKVAIVRTDAQLNAAVLEWKPSGPFLQVPLEDVEAVWQVTQDRWCIRLSGYFTHEDHTTVYRSRPGFR